VTDEQLPPLDPTGPIRGADALEQLLVYVHTTNPNNETDWLEWKRGLDLTKAEGKIAVARTILGFANREPASARRHADGCAFMVLGLEPGSVTGQDSIDPSALTQGLRPYLGSQGQSPVWSALWGSFEGVGVLVIMVEPPGQGDPIYTLKKTHGPTEAGTIFVRHPGLTDRAGPEDVEMLAARLSQAAPQLEIVVSSPSTLYAVDGSSEAVAAWTDDERDQLLQPLHDDQQRKATERTQTPVFGRTPFDAASLAASHSLMGMLGRRVPEDRSAEDYNAEVEEYLELARSQVVPVAMVSLFDTEFAEFIIKVTNTTDRNFANVRLKLTFGPEVRLDPEGLPIAMPKRPRSWGPRQEGGVDLEAFSRVTSQPYDFSSLTLDRSPATLDHHISGRTVSYWVNNLRPRDEYESEPISVLLDPLVGQTVSTHWTATSTQIDGVAEGDLSIPVSERRAPLDALVPHATEKEA